MNRKQAYTDLAAERDAISLERTMLTWLLMDMAEEKTIALGTAYDEGKDSRYVYRLANVTGACGGVVAQWFYCKGQRVQVRVMLLDQLIRDRAWMWNVPGMAHAVEQAQIQRNRALEAVPS